MPLPIKVFPEKCLKSIHRASACELCRDVCPTEAINFSATSLRFDPLKCTQCAACVAICPTDVFATEDLSDEMLMNLIEEKRENLREIIFSCQQIQNPASNAIVITCLARLDRSLLLSCCITPYTSSLQLVHGDCDTCHFPCIKGIFADTLAYVQRVLDAFKSNVCVSLVNLKDTSIKKHETIDGMTRQGHLKRRLFLNLFGKKASNNQTPIVVSKIPKVLQENCEADHLFKKNNRLVSALKSLQQEFLLRDASATIGKKPIIDIAKCKECSICTKVCPTGALHMDAEEYFLIACSPQLCIECYLCADVCFSKAIFFVSKTIDDISKNRPMILVNQEKNTPTKEPSVTVFRT